MGKGAKAMKVGPIETGVLVEERRVDNPTTSWAQFLYELDHGQPYAGQNRVAVNLTTLMGGFARFRGTEAQQKAAGRFKSLYERSQLGGSKAVDPSIEAVDGGKNNPEAIFEIGADARRAYIEAQAFLGPVDFKHAEFVIIGENGPTAYARYRLRGERANNGQVTARYQVEFRRIMDRLSELWGYQSKGA